MESDTKRPGGAAHVVGRLAFIRSLQTALNIHPSDSLGYNNNDDNDNDNNNNNSRKSVIWSAVPDAPMLVYFAMR